MATKYSQIKSNTIFDAKGGKFRKIDDLYFVDVVSGYEAMWDPMFDATISTVSDEPSTAPAEEAYITDPQSRLIKRNPNYEGETVVLSETDKAMGELWGSACFDCGPEDYTFMVEKSIEALKTLYVLEGITGVFHDHVALENYVRSMTDAKSVADRVAVEATISTKKIIKREAKKAPTKGRGR